MPVVFRRQVSVICTIDTLVLRPGRVTLALEVLMTSKMPTHVVGHIFEPFEPRFMLSSVAVLDSALADVAGLRSALGADVTLVEFNRQTDAPHDVIASVLNALGPGETLDSLSIFSHGREGRFQFGRRWVDTDTLGVNDWQELRTRFSDGGQLQIYACETGVGPAGQQLVDRLADLTGAAVWASDDITGLGGDWELEVTSAHAVGSLGEVDPIIDTAALANWQTSLIGDISGTIYEDVNGDGSMADGVGASGVTIDLYDDSGATAGEIDGTDAYVTNTTTAADGTFSFAGLADGTYWVVVHSTDIAPSDGLNATYTQGDVWAEQTYGTAGAVQYSGAAYSYLGVAGTLYGGMRLEQSDDASALTTAEHVTKVTVAGGNVTGVDSGFSFQAITRTGDADDDGVNNRSMQGGFRQFMKNSNAILGTQTSQFAMSTSDSNYDDTGNSEWTFAMTSLVEETLDGVVLDGTTQSTYAGTPIIKLDGSLLGSGRGLYVRASASGTTVRGLAITNFASQGLDIECEALVVGNYIGLDVDGTTAAGNGSSGIILRSGSSNSVIGGTTAADRNVISDNAVFGIQIVDPENVTVQGNYIGLNAAGDTAVGNASHGISIDGSNDNILIGGTAAGAGNVISGNIVGIQVLAAVNLRIEGNLIGTDAAGTSAIKNNFDGINVGPTSTSVTIGGSTAAARNIISGNQYFGVRLRGPNAVVQGNYIGLDITGTAALANGDAGMEVNDTASNNTLRNNVISGNANEGIDVQGGAGLTVVGNLVGTNAAGDAALANGSSGIWVAGPASGVVIGGSTVADRNVISGNTSIGLNIDASGTVVRGNYIGTDVTGTAALGNGATGISILAGANNGTVDGNVIAGNTTHGVYDQANSALYTNNLVGTAANGVDALGNGGSGISLGPGVSNVTIGGEGVGNTIAYNGASGVMIGESAGTGNAILANSIHSNFVRGIDIGPGSVTPNDQGDPDTGANNLQNFAVLAAVGTNEADSLWISGTLNSLASTTFRIEFFSNTALDGVGYGEGETYLGYVEVTTDANGDATLTLSLTVNVAAGLYITSTTTNLSTMDTSEFSAGLKALVASDVILDVNAAASHSIGGADTQVSPTPSITDSIGDWDGGRLIVALQSPAQSYDAVFIRSGTASITVSGTTVMYGGVAVATASATEVTGTTGLAVTFNASATEAAVESLIRAMYFQVQNTSSTVTSQRTARFELVTGRGVYATDTTTITVSPAPEPEPEPEPDPEPDPEPAPEPEPEPEPQPEPQPDTEPDAIDTEPQPDNSDERFFAPSDEPGPPPEESADPPEERPPDDPGEDPEEESEQTDVEQDMRDDEPQDNPQPDPQAQQLPDSPQGPDPDGPWHMGSLAEEPNPHHAPQNPAGEPQPIVDQAGSMNAYREEPIAEAELIEEFSETIEKVLGNDTAEKQQQVRTLQIVAGTTTVLLSTGYLVWVIQAGLLKSALLTSLPLWRWMDPLPILSQDPRGKKRRHKRDHSDKDTDHVENMFTFQ